MQVGIFSHHSDTGLLYMNNLRLELDNQKMRLLLFFLGNPWINVTYEQLENLLLCPKYMVDNITYELDFILNPARSQPSYVQKWGTHEHGGFVFCPDREAKTTSKLLKIKKSSRNFIYIDNNPVEVNETEYRFLTTLARKKGSFVPVSKLINEAWPETNGEGVSMDSVHSLVKRLRAKIADQKKPYTYLENKPKQYRLINALYEDSN